MKLSSNMINTVRNPNSSRESRLQPVSSVATLKKRLEWGQPGLTILDVRDREVFNKLHILGAMCMSVDNLVELAKATIDQVRDIYVYGDSDAETAQAANLLRMDGFTNVTELKGGLKAWNAIAGATEGTEDTPKLDSGAYNLFSRINHHLQILNKLKVSREL